MPNDLFQHFIECSDPYALFFIPKKNLGNKAYFFSSKTPLEKSTLRTLNQNTNLSIFGFLSFEKEPFFYETNLESKRSEDVSITRDILNQKIQDQRLKNHFSVLNMENQESYSDWEKMIVSAKEKFNNLNHLKKIVLHRKINIELNKPVSLNNLLETLPEISDQHYFFLFKNHSEIIVSYSPETLCHYQNELLTSISLAGTAARDLENTREDQKLADDLLNDEKNLKEQNLVTERIKKDLSTFATELNIGPKYILKQKFVQHLAQNITALVPWQNIWPLIEVLHPTPALGGEPQTSALEVIKEIEQNPRKEYGASFGYSLAGEIQLAVNIRCMKIHLNHNIITLFGGCGILEESDPRAEWIETENKMRHFINHFKRN